MKSTQPVDKKRSVTPDDETENAISHYYIFSFPTALAVKAGGWKVWHYQYFHLLTSWPRLNCEGHCHRYLEIGSESEGVGDFCL